MAATKELTKPKTPEAVPEERERIVDPKAVELSHAGQCWRELLVRMPRDATADDLRDPSIWKDVQKSKTGTPLIKMDHLFVLGHDESWFCRALVTHATDKAAFLHIEKVGTFRDPAVEQLYDDGEYRVYWTGKGYGIQRGIQRVKDGVRMGTTEYFAPEMAAGQIKAMKPRMVD